MDSLEQQVEQHLQKVIRISAADAPKGETQQPDDQDNRFTPTDSIDPPENLDRLASLTGISPIRRSCIQAITLNTVGLGVEVVPRKGMEEQVQEGDLEKALDLLNACARRDTRSQSPTFAELIQRVKWDEQEVGNGYLEVSRNRLTGTIDGLFHAPGKRVRRLKDRSGWVIGSRGNTDNDRIRFDNFGDKVIYADGSPTSGLTGRGKRWDRNELIAFQLYTSESRDYGLPPDTQLAWDYLGDKNAAEANVSFFDGQGVPPTVFFIKADAQGPNGEEQKIQIDPKTVKAIADTMRPAEGQQKRVAIVPLPAGTSAQKEDMAKVSDRDVGFVAYRSDNRRRTLGAFRLAPIFVADIEDAGKDTAGVEKSLTKEQVFDPEQHGWEERLSDTLLRDLGFPYLRFDFAEIDTADPGAERQAANDAADKGLITNGEYREKMGFPPLPETKPNSEPEPGEVPFGWNSQLVRAGADGAIQRGVESAASLLAEAQTVGAVGVEANVGDNA